MEDDAPNPSQSRNRAPKTGHSDPRSIPSRILGQADATSFWAELKRRKVARVAITYAIVAWVIIQVASATFGWFDIPKWAFQFVVIMLVTFFPVAIIVAWAFELTPDGIKTTKRARDERGGASSTEAEQRSRNLRAIGFAAALPTLIFGTLAVFFFFRAGPSQTEAPVAPVDAVAEEEHIEKSIAVLPLINMSPDPDNAFFADGVHEDILTNLSKIEELLVISRTSTLGYRDTNKNLKQIGEELGVRYLVEGSVRRAGEQVLVTAQLIDTQTDAHLWAENFNRPLDDIFAIQAEIAKTIAGQLHAVISPEVSAKIEYRPTENQEAYDYYTKYRQMIDTEARNYQEKASVLENAVALDPKFVEAWACITNEYVTLWEFNNRRDPEILAKAHAALDMAESLDPNSAYVLLAKSFIAKKEHRDYETRIPLLLEALTVDPALDNGYHLLGGDLMNLGRLSEAQYYFEKAAKIEPLNPKIARALYTVHFRQANWSKCRSLIEKNIREDVDSNSWQRRLVELNYIRFGDRQAYLDGLKALPEFQESDSLMTWHAIVSRDFSTAQERLSNTGWGGEILSRYTTQFLLRIVSGEEGWSEGLQEGTGRFQDYMNRLRDPGPRVFTILALLRAVAKDREAMERAIAKARALTGTPFYSYTEGLEVEIRIAMCYLFLGDQDAALSILEAASTMEGPIFLARELDAWFIFDELRGNPRFDALLKFEG